MAWPNRKTLRGAHTSTCNALRHCHFERLFQDGWRCQELVMMALWKGRIWHSRFSLHILHFCPRSGQDCEGSGLPLGSKEQQRSVQE